MMQHEELRHGVNENLFALDAALGFGSMLPKERGRIEKAMACAAKVQSRPIIPSDPLVRRFGWGDSEVVQHLAACVDQTRRKELQPESAGFRAQGPFAIVLAEPLPESTLRSSFTLKELRVEKKLGGEDMQINLQNAKDPFVVDFISVYWSPRGSVQLPGRPVVLQKCPSPEAARLRCLGIALAAMKAEVADLAEELLTKHNEAMFARLEDWLLKLNESLKAPALSVAAVRNMDSQQAPAASLMVPPSPVLSAAPARSISPFDFETASDRPDAAERPRASVGRMDSRAEDEARLKGERMSEHFREIEKSHAANQETVELDSGFLAVCRRCSGWLLKTQTAHIFFGLVVVSNSLFLGVQLEYHSNTKDYSSNSEVFMILHLIYAVLFTVEVCLHLVAEGFVDYFWGEDWHWNWLDSFVVTSSWVELIIDLATPEGGHTGRANSNLRALRLLRVGRLFRVVRIIRVVKFFRSLRTLVHSLAASCCKLLQGAAGCCKVLQGAARCRLQVGSSSSGAGQGVFCNSAIKAAESDHELVVQSLLQTRQELRDQVSVLFHQLLGLKLIGICSAAALHSAELVLSLRIDERGHGQISFTDFENLFADDGVWVDYTYIQFDCKVAAKDKDGDHTISVDEFTERCLQLHGPAKSADLFAIRQGKDPG
eukprot:Skav200387  [mRNA]  locus=scaffold2518:434805:443210:- [translate_table: standard]